MTLLVVPLYNFMMENFRILDLEIIKKHANDEIIQSLTFKGQLNYFVAKQRAANQKLKVKKIVAKKTLDDYRYMGSCISKIFPHDKELDAILASEQYQNRKQPTNLYNLQQVPLHYQDNEWMKKYIPDATDRIKSQDDSLSSLSVHNFVENTVFYQTVKKAFEVELVGAQIRYMMQCSKPNVFMDENSKLFEARNLPNFDNFFRNEVKQMFMKRGLQESVIENGLDTFAADWRQQAMIIAFENEYYPFLATAKVYQKNDKWGNGLFKLKEKHQALWLKRREYDYYQAHKSTLKKSVTKNMLMDRVNLKLLDLKLAAVTKTYKKFMNNRKRYCVLNTASQDKNRAVSHTEKNI